MIAHKGGVKPGTQVSYRASSPTKLPVYAISGSDTCSIDANGMINVHSAGLCAIKFMNFGDAVYRAKQTTVFLDVTTPAEPSVIEWLLEVTNTILEYLSAVVASILK
jgi:hypothetical protein